MAPFQLVWSDISNNIFTESWFPIGFPNTPSPPQQLQVRTNAITLQTYETLTNVKLYLTGDPDDIHAIQEIWPTLGGSSRPELNGGYDISFDFGRTYLRFDATHGLESDPGTWVTLPALAVGVQGTDGILGPFDTAHFVLRVIVPPGADQFKKLDVRLAMDFDII